MGTWESGTLNVGTRCFDLLCTGKCDLTMSSLKLNIESSNKIPNFFTKNGDGKIVFSNPAPMSVITTPKGHGTWIQIELKTINGVSTDSLSDIAKHVCLGIKKRSEIDYFDVIHAGKLTSEYVDLFDTDAVELVPLLSKTEVTSNSYEIVKPGEEITPSDFGLTGTSFDFGSVYRVNIKDCGAWIERECNLSALDDDTESQWYNEGNIGVGLLDGQKEKQFLAIKTNGKLTRSIDGLSWFAFGKVEETGWSAGSVYGNGTWCIINCKNKNVGVKRSIDGGKTWLSTNGKIKSNVLAFGKDIFMTIDAEYFTDNGTLYHKVYTSTDAENWIETGAVPGDTGGHTFLTYGNDKWICSSFQGNVYQSNNGKEWEHISDDLKNIIHTCWTGCCYAKGYFYAVRCAYVYRVMRSATGEKWEEIFKPADAIRNITYYRNKLYSIGTSGNICYIGIPNP